MFDIKKQKPNHRLSAGRDAAGNAACMSRPAKGLTHPQEGAAWTPSSPDWLATHSEMHSGPDAPAGQSTRHSEVGRATACQAHPRVRCGAPQCLPSASGPFGVRPLGPDTVDGPDTHGWPLQCLCGATGKPELRQLNILYLGGLGMGKVG